MAPLPYDRAAAAGEPTAITFPSWPSDCAHWARFLQLADNWEVTLAGGIDGRQLCRDAAA